jgi:hypothetical protein
MERAQQEKAEREALARIPEHVKMAELLKDAKVSMATMSGSVYGSEMWTVKAVLTNCITVMDFIMREMFPGEEGSKHNVD